MNKHAALVHTDGDTGESWSSGIISIVQNFKHTTDHYYCYYYYNYYD
jgi:hypothetical protein